MSDLYIGKGLKSFLICICTAACAPSQSVAPVQADEVSYVDIPIVATDYPTEGKVYVSFRNDYDHPVCVPYNSWPTQNGRIGLDASRAFLAVGNETYGSVGWNGGLCKGSCSFKVEAGEVAEAALSYEAFELPENLYRSEKVLTLKPVAFEC